MKINLRQFASYAARQFAGRSGQCCGTPGSKRLVFGDGEQPGPVPCNCDFDANWGGPYSYSFFNRSFTTPEYCLTLPVGCEYKLYVTAGPSTGGIGDFNLIKNGVDVTPLPDGIQTSITLVNGDCFALQWDLVSPVLDDNYVNFDISLAYPPTCEVFSMEDAVFIDYTEETYYILAETGDVLNTENSDRLRTETP